MKVSTSTTALNPWDELRLVKRPSIFLQDPRFRTAKAVGTIESEEGLGYKQFGVFTRAKERQPNKHEGTLENAKTKTTRANNRKTSKDV
jgi:hypothetical protein